MWSNLLASLSLAVSIFTFCYTKRQLDYIKKAYVRPKAHRGAAPVLTLMNSGQGLARNIRIIHETDNPVFPQPSGSVVCDWLPPNQDF